MVTINSNNINLSSTYTAKSNNQSEISRLQKERESLQEEVQSLQQEISTNTGDSSETIQAEIETLQSQITNIDSQISRLQSEDSEGANSKSEISQNEKFIDSPMEELKNPETLKNSLNKLSETTKMLENSIGMEKARGFNSNNKSEVVSNMKKNIDNITSRLEGFEEEEVSTNTLNGDVELVGNFLNTKV